MTLQQGLSELWAAIGKEEVVTEGGMIEIVCLRERQAVPHRLQR